MKEEFQNLHLQLSSDDIKKIDIWKVENGMKSRAEAIRSMIKLALQANDFKPQIVTAMKEKQSNFMLPNIANKSKNNEKNFEDIIRKIVKEELQKAIKNN
ncbi:MAG: hypothetical protein SFT90_04335 [Rickettsiales bacterium]|nr:hypothetical protein [Rickettsiales bacterium]